MIINHLELPATPIVSEIYRVTGLLAGHKLYRSIHSVPGLRLYMEHQVWCVWDFMTLVKAIQTHCLCGSVAWVPPTDALTGHQIYEILMTEETDIDETGGRHSSHFDTYLRAMSQAGADRTAIDAFIVALRAGTPVDDALNLASPPPAALDFVNVTLKIARGSVEGVVAAFCLSREGIIPEMFTQFLANLPRNDNLSIFEWYLRRHVAIDSECHGPQSVRLFKHVVGGDPVKQAASLEVALEALEARRLFLDRILEALPSQKC